MSSSSNVAHERRPVSLRHLLRHPVDTVESLESSALVVGAIVFVIGAVVEALVYWNEPLEIAGRGSLGDFVAVGGALAAILAFVFGRVLLGRATAEGARYDHLESPGARLHWFDVFALAAAHGAIALLGWVGSGRPARAELPGRGRLPVPRRRCSRAWRSPLTAYAVFLSAVRMTPMLLSLVLAVFLARRRARRMLSSSDPLWWQKNLSALGMTNDISSLAFNLTLIIAGVIVTTIARYATAGLPATHAEGGARPPARARTGSCSSASSSRASASSRSTSSSRCTTRWRPAWRSRSRCS